jgi:two-component sensor histidine kinase
MRLPLTHVSVGRWFLIAAVVVLLMPVEIVLAQVGQKRVLVLYATRRDAQIAVVGERELPRILETRLSRGIDYYSEFIDEARFSNAYYQIAFGDFLRVKYGSQPFDVVIAMGDMPLAFVAENRDTLFRDMPVVFFANRAPPNRLTDATGVIAALNLKDTLRLATTLQPDVRNVFVVSGARRAEHGFEGEARAQFKEFESQLTVTYLSGLPTRQLEARLASLPAHSVIYYLYVDRDGSNEYFHPLDYLDRVTAVAKVPVYCWVDSAMGRGIVGGSLKDQVAQTHAVAEVSVRVLEGEAADSIPIATPNLNVSQVDWRQLRRWGISESRVPAGTIVRFREPSAWERYNVYILAAATVLVAQTALIAGLLVQRARRRRAEQRIRDLGARLLNAQESERSRIARELHDDVSQQMALLEMDLEVLGGSVQAGAEDIASEALDRARDVARTVHELSHRLHPAKLRLIGLVPALKGLQREMGQSGIEITLAYEDVPGTLSHELTLCLFRIVQEALQNAIKYSQARRVSVHLICEPHALQLTIVDDGVGFDVRDAWGKGLGLLSMTERVEAIGGRLTIRSKRGMGVRLHVTVPLQPSPDLQPSPSDDVSHAGESRTDQGQLTSR